MKTENIKSCLSYIDPRKFHAGVVREAWEELESVADMAQQLAAAEARCEALEELIWKVWTYPTCFGEGDTKAAIAAIKAAGGER